MWLAKDRFEDCVKSILALQPGVRALNSNNEPAYHVRFCFHLSYVLSYVQN